MEYNVEGRGTYKAGQSVTLKNGESGTLILEEGTELTFTLSIDTSAFERGFKIHEATFKGAK